MTVGTNRWWGPLLEQHCLEVAAEAFLEETKPIVVPSPAAALLAGPRAWFVLQTVMRGEDKVVQALAELGFETYAPMMKKEVWNRRKRISTIRQFRLFNRYLFAHLPVATRHWKTVEDVAEIDCVLGANGVPCPIPESDILRFRAAEAERQFDDTKINRFPLGSRIRAVDGPFGGFAGRVVSVAGRGVVKAMLDIFGRMVPVEFRYDTVEPD